MRAESWADAPAASTPVMSVVATFDGGKEERVSIVQAAGEMYAVRDGEPGAARLTAPAVTDVIGLLEPAKPASARAGARPHPGRLHDRAPRPPRGGGALPLAGAAARRASRPPQQPLPSTNQAGPAPWAPKPRRRRLRARPSRSVPPARFQAMPTRGSERRSTHASPRPMALPSGRCGSSDSSRTPCSPAATRIGWSCRPPT